jgi:hypothetical protein
MADLEPLPNWPERHTAACIRLGLAETTLRAILREEAQS